MRNPRILVRFHFAPDPFDGALEVRAYILPGLVDEVQTYLPYVRSARREVLDYGGDVCTVEPLEGCSRLAHFESAGNGRSFIEYDIRLMEACEQRTIVSFCVFIRQY